MYSDTKCRCESLAALIEKAACIALAHPRMDSHVWNGWMNSLCLLHLCLSIGTTDDDDDDDDGLYIRIYHR